jgi:hypothetical protein
MEASHILLELYVSLLSQKKHDDVHSSLHEMIPPVTLRHYSRTCKLSKKSLKSRKSPNFFFHM